ncbi:MAG: hypothetical protein JNL92_11460 [Opitutaceae bacterium]|nr:hypothetical protein [Opitutaceae bacterium]
MALLPRPAHLAATCLRRLALLVVATAGFMPARAAEAAGHLRIDAEGGLQVFLDGNLRGATSAATGGLLLENIPAGEHRLTVVKRGFAPDEQPLAVRPGFVTVAATFSLEPRADAGAPAPDPRPNPLAAIDQARADLRVAEGAHAAAGPPPPPGSYSATEYSEALRRHSLRLQAARAALAAARRLVTETEEAVSARFRTEYAAIRRLGREPGISFERRQTAWRAFAATWRIEAGERPATVVWRNQRPEIARGNLLIRVGPSWPAQLGAPAFFIDGRPVAAAAAAGGDARTWEIGALTATTHTLRIEHPAIEAGTAEFVIRDGMATSLNWTPKFSDRRRP